MFRLVVAGLFLVAGRSLQLGSESPTLFVATSFAYVAAVLALGFPDSARLIGLRRLVTIQVLVDVTLLTLVMWSSGGYRSGIPILILIALAGAGLVGEGGWCCSTRPRHGGGAAREHLRHPVGAADGGFLHRRDHLHRLLRDRRGGLPAILRAAANEKLARQRGVDLASQLRLNRQIIQDMQDGVLVVGEDGLVRQFNPARRCCWAPACGRAAAGGLRAGPGPGPAGIAVRGTTPATACAPRAAARCCWRASCRPARRGRRWCIWKT